MKEDRKEVKVISATSNKNLTITKPKGVLI